MSAKPNLRNIGKRQWGLGLGLSLIASAAFAVWFKYNVLEARKERYKRFHETYDDEANYQAMKRAGVFKGFEWSP